MFGDQLQRKQDHQYDQYQNNAYYYHVLSPLRPAVIFDDTDRRFLTGVAKRVIDQDF